MKITIGKKCKIKGFPGEYEIISGDLSNRSVGLLLLTDENNEYTQLDHGLFKIELSGYQLERLLIDGVQFDDHRWTIIQQNMV